MIAKRLFALMPPHMPVSTKHAIVEVIWKRYGPHSRKYVYVGSDTDYKAAMSDIARYFDGLTVQHAIPDQLERQFDWLSDNDVAVKQQLLNYFMNAQRSAALASISLNLSMMLERMKADKEGQIVKLGHIAFVGNHQLDIRADPLRSGFLFSDSPNDSVKPPVPPTKFPVTFVAIAIVIAVIWYLSSLAHSEPSTNASHPVGYTTESERAQSETVARQAVTPTIAATNPAPKPRNSVRSASSPAFHKVALISPSIHPASAPIASAVASKLPITRPALVRDNSCASSQVADVEDDGATIRASNGDTFTVSPDGTMRFLTAQWSTGDAVTICISRGSAASIENPTHYAKVQATLESHDHATSIFCDDAQLTRMSDDGARIDASDGYSFVVSEAGTMRFLASQWSTSDHVVVCMATLPGSVAAASIANPVHYAKVQATVSQRTASSPISCVTTTLSNVSNEGTSVVTGNGRSYTVVDIGTMRFLVQQWSTGDSVTICESRISDGSIAASIADPAHYSKVQASRV